MATTWKGRSSTSSRPAHSGSSYGAAQTRWGWNHSAGKRAESTPSTSATASKTKRTGSGNWSGSAAYKTVCNSFVWKINSFKTLHGQALGGGKFERPSPTILNSFARWVNKGAIVQMVSTAQLSRWARSSNANFNSRNPTIAACKSVLWSKYGKIMIKAVARAKNGAYLVATPAQYHGRAFSFAR